jgi:hypothetical protein
MNLAYLNSMPEVANKFNIDLQEGEKVVFTAKLATLGTEADRMLGADNSVFTLTNKSIIADNGAGTWTVDMASEVVSCTRVKGRSLLIFPFDYFQIMLNKEILFDSEKQKLTGFNFHFKRADREKFEAIMKRVFA